MFTVGQIIKTTEDHTIYSEGHEGILPEGSEVTITAVNDTYGDYVNVDVEFTADITFGTGDKGGVDDYDISFNGTLNIDLEA